MGEPLVLLPGLFSDARIFSPQLTALSREMPVTVAPTAKYERIEEAASDLLTQTPQRFALAGQCLGGAIALEILRRAPERVTRIALIGTSPLAETPQDAAAREAEIVAMRAGRFEEIIRDILSRGWFVPGPHRNDLIAKLVAMAKANGVEATVRQMRAMQRRKDQQSTARKVKQPVLVVCGDQDGVTPYKRQEFMAELIPYAKLEVVDDSGHLPMLDQPQATTEILRAWMRQPLVLR